jgi:2-oxoglutarate dehydrogenase E2 component (dihydrolipoamide succinyltransferase)
MPTSIVVPPLGESVVEATVGKWFKKEGETVTVGDALVELETDKVNLEVSAAKSGVLACIERAEGAEVKIGDLLGIIDETAVGAADASPPAEPADPTPDETEAPAEGHDERITPLARRMAEEAGVDTATLHGSGSGGRVLKQDVEKAIADHKKETPLPAPQAAPALDRALSGREEIIPMSRRRRTIARRLVEAQHTAAMLTTFNEIDMSAVMEMRTKKREVFEKRHGVRLGFMSFFVKAAIGALRDFPLINAEIRDDQIVVKRYYDIGMAVGAEEGLVVPVLRDADRLSFAGIEKTIKELADRVKNGSISLEDLRGGTFTITNGGVFGSLLSTPILNPPQVGILGLHKIEDRPVALNGQVAIRPMMYVALSYDHRIVDGREAVQFLVRVREQIEDPACLLLDI